MVFLRAVIFGLHQGEKYFLMKRKEIITGVIP